MEYKIGVWCRLLSLISLLSYAKHTIAELGLEPIARCSCNEQVICEQPLASIPAKLVKETTVSPAVIAEAGRGGPSTHAADKTSLHGLSHHTERYHRLPTTANRCSASNLSCSGCLFARSSQADCSVRLQNNETSSTLLPSVGLGVLGAPQAKPSHISTHAAY